MNNLNSNYEIKSGPIIGGQDTSEPVHIENGRSSFTLSLQRKDGSFYLDKSGEPKQREITINTTSSKIIETIRESVEENCKRLIKQLKTYGPFPVLHRFDKACKSTMDDAVARIAGAALTPLPPAQSQAANGGGEDEPGTPKFHHSPTDEQRQALGKFGKYIRPRNTHREL